MSLFDRSASEPCRLRITGIPSLNLSATCCASLKGAGGRGGRAPTARPAPPGPGSLRRRRRRLRLADGRGDVVARIRPVVGVRRPLRASRGAGRSAARGSPARYFLVRGVAVLVPLVVILRDAEVDEVRFQTSPRPMGATNVTPGAGCFRPGRASRLPRPRRGPATSPSKAPPLAARRARADA